MRLLTSSCANRWKTSESQLYSSTPAGVLILVKWLVLSVWGCIQELCSMEQDVINSPCLNLMFSYSPFPFILSFQICSLVSYLFAQVESAPFLGYMGTSLSWAGLIEESCMLSWHHSASWADEDRAGRDIWRNRCFRPEHPCHSVLSYGFWKYPAVTMYKGFWSCCKSHLLWLLASPLQMSSKQNQTFWALLNTVRGFGLLVPLVGILTSGPNFELMGQSLPHEFGYQ